MAGKGSVLAAPAAEAVGDVVAGGGVRGLQASGEYGPGGGDGATVVSPKSNGYDDEPSVM
jgi:hypothetical protein